jgi:hypothetical protein
VMSETQGEIFQASLQQSVSDVTAPAIQQANQDAQQQGQNIIDNTPAPELPPTQGGDSGGGDDGGGDLILPN